MTAALHLRTASISHPTMIVHDRVSQSISILNLREGRQQEGAGHLRAPGAMQAHRSKICGSMRWCCTAPFTISCCSRFPISGRSMRSVPRSDARQPPSPASSSSTVLLQVTCARHAHVDTQGLRLLVVRGQAWLAMKHWYAGAKHISNHQAVAELLGRGLDIPDPPGVAW